MPTDAHDHDLENENGSDEGPGAQQSPPSTPKKPFPLVQLIILILIQFSEPVTSTVIYPFVNQFVRDTGVTRGDEKKTGYYAGIIESIFFLSECLSVYHWGRLSDRIGRRPVLLLGPLGLALAMTFFGLSRNFWMLVVSRCAQGVFNGNLGVSRSMMVEITDPEDLPTALGWIPAMWSAGITLGPVVGGATADPARRWPETFGQISFFRDYPYFLPCAAAGSVAFGAYLFAYISLHESLPSAILRNACGRRDRQTVDANSGTSRPTPTTPLLDSRGASLEYRTESLNALDRAEEADAFKPPPFLSLLTGSLLIPYINHSFFSFLDQVHQVLLPLMLSTSIRLGGLGFDAFTIGMIMGTWGIFNAVFQVIFFARVVKWLGPRTAYIACFACFMTTFTGYPVMSLLARRAGGVDCRVWAVLVLQLFLHCFAYMSYGCCQLFVMDAAPGQASLGAVNGLAQMLSAVVRTIAPTLASSLFSISLQEQFAGGYMVYLVIVGITLAGLSTAFLLPMRLKAQREKV
ncbi:putative major facilitator superfamily protein [Lyophyllum shimeji]|uniref:Major facilitator superfamily protein n=1 Tax=Lyophyllum shimeji TaxID=47721 RepID=A0A9P3Q0R2_LYOSH|nr:putative major facilitator superfamily protein [Lyophyllum shimeji]